MPPSIIPFRKKRVNNLVRNQRQTARAPAVYMSKLERRLLFSVIWLLMFYLSFDTPAQTLARRAHLTSINEEFMKVLNTHPRTPLTNVKRFASVSALSVFFYMIQTTLIILCRKLTGKRAWGLPVEHDLFVKAQVAQTEGLTSVSAVGLLADGTSRPVARKGLFYALGPLGRVVKIVANKFTMSTTINKLKLDQLALQEELEALQEELEDTKRYLTIRTNLHNKASKSLDTMLDLNKRLLEKVATLSTEKMSIEKQVNKLMGAVLENDLLRHEANELMGKLLETTTERNEFKKKSIYLTNKLKSSIRNRHIAEKQLMSLTNTLNTTAKPWNKQVS